MSRENCEKMRISAMAILDNEEPLVSANEVNEHIRSCADCRRQLEQQKQATMFLAGQSRRVFAEDVWPEVAVAMESLAKRKHPCEMPFFVALGLLLLAYKVIEVLPGITAGVAVKLTPLVIVFVFFRLLKQNPLAINQSLKLEGDTK